MAQPAVGIARIGAADQEINHGRIYFANNYTGVHDDDPDRGTKYAATMAALGGIVVVATLTIASALGTPFGPVVEQQKPDWPSHHQPIGQNPNPQMGDLINQFPPTTTPPPWLGKR